MNARPFPKDVFSFKEKKIILTSIMQHIMSKLNNSILVITVVLLRGNSGKICKEIQKTQSSLNLGSVHYVMH